MVQHKRRSKIRIGEEGRGFFGNECERKKPERHSNLKIMNNTSINNELRLKTN